MHFKQPKLAVAVLTAAFAVSSFARAPNPEVKSHTASENAFRVGSYAIVSDGEIALVDTQMMLDEADKFVAMVKKVKGTVKTIFITHAHPDHYLGLARVKAAFPEARVVAMPDTVDLIAKNGMGALTFYRTTFMGGALAPNLATEIPAIEKLEGNVLKVGKSDWEVLSFDDAESTMAHALWHKQSSSLISGDLTYNGVYMWLADPEGDPAKWHQALEELKTMNVKQIYPGHGKPGRSGILTQNLQYLAFFDSAVKASKSAEELKLRVYKQYPKLQVRPVVEFAATKYFPPQAAAPAPAPAPAESKPAEGAMKPEASPKK